MQLLLGEDASFLSLLAVVQAIATGAVPDLTAALAVSMLVPLRKSNGGIRPLAILIPYHLSQDLDSISRTFLKQIAVV